MSVETSIERGQLHMVSMRLDAARLMELGRRRRLPMVEADPGYLVHCMLGELFGELAPQAFMIVSDQGRLWHVLAYAEHPAEALRERGQAKAEPAFRMACEWAALASKAMPEEWPVGKRLGFELRLCPTVRAARESEHHRKGAEVDVFLTRGMASGDGARPLDREAVYREWLGEHLERLGGARLLSARMLSFRRVRLLRRTQGEERKAKALERPEVLFQGEIEVTDREQFNRLLHRGVGRHRGFGFGMLLLKPLTPASC